MQRYNSKIQLTYTQLRALQISIVFAFTLLIQFWWRYPNAPLTGYVLMLIYAGFDNGSTIRRAYYRFLGTLFGIIVGSFLWIIGNLDHRLIILIFPILIYCVYFFSDHDYNLPALFAVCSALVGSGYYAAYEGTSTARYLALNYTICSIIAFFILIIFEYMLFRRFNHMRRFVIESQTAMLINLFNLVTYLNHSHTTSRKSWFDECAKLIDNLKQTERLLMNTQFVIGEKVAFGSEFQFFFERVNQIYGQLKSLYFATHCQKNSITDLSEITNQVNRDIYQLEALYSKELETIDWDNKHIYVAIS